jgi:hypothetical protein
MVGTAYSQTLAATGDATITWKLTTGSSLPAGLTLNGTTGVISGTPTAAATTTFTVIATNNAGNDSKELTITINPLPTFTITATKGDNGNISPSGAITITKGGSQTFIFAPATCYEIDEVTVDGTPETITGSSYTFTNVDDNHTIHVTFKKDVTAIFTITATSDANGTISPNGATSVNCGENQTFAYDPNSGYEVDRLLIDGSNVAHSATGGTYTFNNVTGNHTIQVVTKALPVASPNGLIFNLSDQQFYLDIAGDGNPANPENIVYTEQSGNWSFNNGTLALNGFTWVTSAPIALRIVNGNITISNIGKNSFSSIYAGTAPSVGILMDNYSLTLTGTGKLVAEGGASTSNSTGISIVYGNFTLKTGTVIAQGETQAVYFAGNIALPAKYNYRTSTTLPVSQNGPGIPYPGNPAFVNSNTFKFVKIVSFDFKCVYCPE